MADVSQTTDSIPPAKRKVLQQWFERANKAMTQEDHDYATNLLTQCVDGDPGNLVYVQTFLGNLKKKYSNAKKGGKLGGFLQGAGSRGSLKKASMQKDWKAVIKSGLEVLKLNPWDISALSSLANACEQLGHEDAQLAYLKTALEANPKDPEVCRLCGRALGNRKEFDQAIALWARVQQALPDDDEAKREISRLTVEKTIVKGNYEDVDHSKKTAKKSVADDRDETEEQRLRRELRRHPEHLPTYIQLANIYMGEKQYDKAEEILQEAYKVSSGDSDILERLEDAQLTGMRYRLSELRKKAQESGDRELKLEHNRLVAAIKAKDLEIYQHRCQRFPNNLAFRYELGRRYQQVGKQKEAIVEFQQAKNDPRFKGLSNFALGQCFEAINQNRLALSHYEASVEDISDRNADDRKEALYLGGKLAISMENLDTASRLLTSLAEMDFSYKDVSDLLDELDRKRND